MPGATGFKPLNLGPWVNYIQHYWLNCDTQHNDALNKHCVIMLTVSMPSVVAPFYHFWRNFLTQSLIISEKRRKNCWQLQNSLAYENYLTSCMHIHKTSWEWLLSNFCNITFTENWYSENIIMKKLSWTLSSESLKNIIKLLLFYFLITYFRKKNLNARHSIYLIKRFSLSVMLHGLSLSVYPRVVWYLLVSPWEGQLV